MTVFDLLLSFKGRIALDRWWLGMLLVFVSAVAGAIVLLLAGVAPDAAMAFIGVAAVYPILALGFKRSHDLGKNGAFALLLLVPVVSLWPVALFGFKSGARVPNQFGSASRGLLRKERVLLIVGGLLVSFGTVIAGLTATALKTKVTFFMSPAEVAASAPTQGKRFRLGGLVESGSFKRLPDAVSVFKVTDNAASLAVRYTGILPDLFREGQGVIAEGQIGPDGVFVADSVLAKHDEKYMPPEVAAALKKNGRWQEQGAKPGGAPGT